MTMKAKQQIPWVDDMLWCWGIWVRQMDQGRVGSTLGRLHKQRMKELRVWAEEPHRPGGDMDDDKMLAVDKAIAKLPKRTQRLVKWRYWHGTTMVNIAHRCKRSVRTTERWLAEAQADVAALLGD